MAATTPKHLEKLGPDSAPVTRAGKYSAVARLQGLWAQFERSDTVLLGINADPAC